MTTGYVLTPGRWQRRLFCYSNLHHLLPNTDFILQAYPISHPGLMLTHK